ncbi:MAG: L-lactate dehydrogenase [Candidatus Babeliales bacterium]
MVNKKIAIIGAGSVGSTIVYALILKNINAEILLIDIDEKRCKGEVLDLSDTLFCGAAKIKSSRLQDVSQADIIIIAAGARQKPKQSRTDLIAINRSIIAAILEQIRPIKQHAIIIMVTNPVDILTFDAQQFSGLPRNQVFGSGTFLDTVRLHGILAKKLNIAMQSINAYILGEHGDTQFAAWSIANIAGVPLLNFPQINKKILTQIAEEARKKAYEIISCKGATYYGIAACVTTICQAIILDQKLVIPLSCYIPTFNICLSIPIILGGKGIEQILEIPLNKIEQQQLIKSAEYLQKLR